MSEVNVTIETSTPKMTTVDKVLLVVGVAALAGCAYRAYNGSSSEVLEDMWVGAKDGAKIGAVVGAAIGIGGGFVVGAPHGKGLECAAIVGFSTAITGAIYGGAMRSAFSGAGLYAIDSVEGSGFVNSPDFV